MKSVILPCPANLRQVNAWPKCCRHVRQELLLPQLAAVTVLRLFSLSCPFPLEYAAINNMLDQINSCLDHLEEKNDYLHACLKELLESNRQTRLEFQQQSEQQNMGDEMQGSEPAT
ncbi:PREDICTED: UPF0184 protein C9orf16 homolog [Tinamus guttatus]|nr:PREDICTED: UPF0184 protein C9orf16 homolog [Tinamus guttatus]